MRGLVHRRAEVLLMFLVLLLQPAAERTPSPLGDPILWQNQPQALLPVEVVVAKEESEHLHVSFIGWVV